MSKGRYLPRRSLICARCGAPFTCVGSDLDRRHCSWECAKPRQEWQDCVVCCGRFLGKRSAKTCSRRCLSWLKAKNRQDQGQGSRVWKDRLLARVGACERCGWDEVPAVLEIHHLDRDRTNNCRPNLVLLCPNCHSVDHYRRLDGQYRNNLGRHAARTESDSHQEAAAS